MLDLKKKEYEKGKNKTYISMYRTYTVFSLYYINVLFASNNEVDYNIALRDVQR